MPAPHASRPSRSWRPVALLVVLLVVLDIGVAGCAGDQHTEPTLPTVDFTPKLEIAISDRQLTMARGRRHDTGVSCDCPDATLPGATLPRPAEATVPAGTVVEIANAGSSSHRLQGGTVFDTGILRPGESTTVVLTNDTTDAKRLDLVDPTDPAVHGTITIQPKAPAP